MSVDPLLQPYRLKHLTPRNRIIITAQEPAYPEDGIDDGRMAGVVDIRQIVKAITPPEPTPVGTSPIPNRRLIHNDTLTQSVQQPSTLNNALRLEAPR